VSYAAILDELRTTAASMDLAAEAGEEGDWNRVEQGLLEVHERSANLLREIGLKLLIDLPPEAYLPRKAG
jgi:hypothetical protein